MRLLCIEKRAVYECKEEQRERTCSGKGRWEQCSAIDSTRRCCSSDNAAVCSQALAYVTRMEIQIIPPHGPKDFGQGKG